MRRSTPLAFAALFLLGLAAAASAGVATAHRISFQGLARNLANQPVATGDVRVRIYDAATSGALVYDSGAEFNGAIVAGAFSVLLGGGTPLLLDATRQYFLELDVNGQEVVGDANGGRQAFWPAGGDASRLDLENRITALENAVFATCAAGVFDLDHNPANGCEFTLDSDGIYVDPNDPNANDGATCGLGPSNTCGGTCIPCLTIAQGLARATTTGRSKVYVADATYNEAVTVVNGKSLLGGYTSGTWARHLGSTSTILRGSTAAGNHLRAVFASGISSPTTVEGFVIYGPNDGLPGGNSYAVYVANSGGLTLRSNVILAGNGGPGADGSTGPGGTDGVAGSAGADAVQSPTSSCNVAMNRSGGAGGALTCSGTAVNGGAGGGNRCTPVAGSEFSGLDGATAAGTGGGAGGDAGDDGQISSSGTGCTPPPNPTIGAAGGNGVAGTNGTGGSGASLFLGSVSGGHWLGNSGSSGSNGNFGRGGGGGGAGGGADGISPSLDAFGGAGGGGGSGGCGGTGGGPGAGGGGSFGIFVTGGGAPTITANAIVRGTGGAGGRGGVGGRGGFGGSGGAGGSSLSIFCVGSGGRGGDGGAGGPGGGGGGGAGGMSCAIYTIGIGSPGYSTSNPAISGGTAGAGGAGGPSPGSAGTTGATGVVLGVSSN